MSDAEHTMAARAGSTDAALLHQLRNRINTMGFALHFHRRDGQGRHLDTLEHALQEAGQLLDTLAAAIRARTTGDEASSG